MSIVGEIEAILTRLATDADILRRHAQGPATGPESLQTLIEGVLKSKLRQQAEMEAAATNATAAAAASAEEAGAHLAAAEAVVTEVAAVGEAARSAVENVRDEVLSAKEDVGGMVAGAANAALFSDDVPGPGGPDLALYGADGLKVASLVGNRDAIAALAAVAATMFSDDVPGSAGGFKVVSADGFVFGESSDGQELGATLTSIKDAASGVSVPAEAIGAPEVIVLRKTLYLYGGLGESIRLGGSGAFADLDLYTTSPKSGYETVFMASPAVRTNGASWSQIVPAYEKVMPGSINSILETGMVRGAYQLLDVIRNGTGKTPNIGVASWGQAGAMWQDLNRGNVKYNEMLLDWRRWVEAGRGQGYRVILAGVINQQGVNDATHTKHETWADMIARSAEQLNEDARRIFGQSKDVPFYLSQPYTADTFGLIKDGAVNDYGVAQGVIDLALRHGLVRAVGGGPHVDRIDGTHSDSLNAIWQNELDFLGVADDQFRLNGALKPACVLDNWRTGEKTWRLKIGASYPLVRDSSNAVVQTLNLAGLYGWEVADGGSIVPIASIDVVGDGGASLPGIAYVDLTFSNSPSAYGELVLGIGVKQGPGGGTTNGTAYPCSIKANVSGGVVTGFTTPVLGTGWLTAPDVVISGAGSGAAAHTTLSAGIPTLVLDNGGSGYGGTSTYARVGRAGMGRVHGARQIFRWQRNAVSSIGWDGLEIETTANPRPLNDFLLRQILRLKR